MMYVAGAWLVLQVVDTVSPWLELSDEFGRLLLVLLMMGLIPTAVLAWLFEWTPDGVRFDEDVEVDSAGTVIARRILDRIIIVLLALAVLYFAADKFLFSDTTLQTAVEGQSIAVLPFEDVSIDGDQSYLAKGIADELRLELQRLDGLRVAGGTSSNAFAKQNRKTVGEALNVASILEGSIRKDGDQIRVTVQLIGAMDGFMIWSQSYDRDRQDVFEMQQEIATSVAGYLGVNLGVGDANAFKGAGTRNVDAYEAYLRSQDVPRGPGSLKASTSLLERATELDQNYGVAWSAMAINTVNQQWSAAPEAVPALTERARELALKGVSATPDSATTQSVLAIVSMYQFDWIDSDRAHQKATAVLSDRKMHGRYAVTLLRAGRLSAAKQQFLLGERIEPMGDRPVPQSWHASLGLGLLDEAREIRSRLPQFDIVEDNLDLAVNEKDPAAFKSAIRDLPSDNLARVHLYEPMLAVFDTPERIVPILESLLENDALRWPRKTHDISMAAAYFGYPELSLHAKRLDILQNSNRIAAIWYPVMSDVRRLPAFSTLMRELKLDNYWRTVGWADACRPLNESEFTCS